MGTVTEQKIPAWFVAQMRRLMGLRFAPVGVVTHWEGLSDVPEAVLTLAVSRAQKARSEFPSPAELREDCDAVVHLVRVTVVEDRGVDLEEAVTIGTLPTGLALKATREWRYYHSDCSDSGTESLWCGEPGPSTKPWQKVQNCERTAPHEAHEWVRRCQCYESNPALIRKREHQQKFASVKAK